MRIEGQNATRWEPGMPFFSGGEIEGKMEGNLGGVAGCENEASKRVACTMHVRVKLTADQCERYLAKLPNKSTIFAK
jgi:hypothetical protein